LSNKEGEMMGGKRMGRGGEKSEIQPLLITTRPKKHEKEGAQKKNYLLDGKKNKNGLVKKGGEQGESVTRLSFPNYWKKGEWRSIPRQNPYR